MENTSFFQRILQQIRQLFSKTPSETESVKKPFVLPEKVFYTKLALAKKHIQAYQALGGKVPTRSLEVSNNDFPIIPLAIGLAGGDEMLIHSPKTTSKEQLQLLLPLFKQAQLQGRLKDYITPSSDKWEILLELIEDLEQLSLDELLEKLNIQYVLASEVEEIKNSSIDLVYSSHFLETLDVKGIQSTLTTGKKIVKKDRGIVSHIVDLTDPRAKTNHTINDYDFLQYTDAQWQKISSKHSHNRLRIYDYKKIYKEIDLYLNYDHAQKGYVYDLQKIPLDIRFQNHSEEEIAIRDCHFVSEFRMFW